MWIKKFCLGLGRGWRRRRGRSWFSDEDVWKRWEELASGVWGWVGFLVEGWVGKGRVGYSSIIRIWQWQERKER